MLGDLFKDSAQAQAAVSISFSCLPANNSKMEDTQSAAPPYKKLKNDNERVDSWLADVEDDGLFADVDKVS